MINAQETTKQSKNSAKSELRPLRWNSQKSRIEVIDQRLLPYELKWLEITNYQEMATAIKDMIIRGAPLIGIGAAYGMAMAARLNEDLDKADELLRTTRPTAVNLHWALDQCKEVIYKWGLERNSCNISDCNDQSYDEKLFQNLLIKAHDILEDDINSCKAMSQCGADYIKEKFGSQKKFKILTHCNAGALATGGYGTALGLIRKLHEENLVEMVYADETRPRQQGSRLSAWELAYDEIPVTMISDNMAAHCMQKGMIDFVIVGSDRITANGDAANKIGTYQVAIVAKYHQIPFYVAAPHSTIDLSLTSGDLIPIEERDAAELHTINGALVTAERGVEFFNPGFDVTPNNLIEEIFTEQGLFRKEG